MKKINKNFDDFTAKLRQKSVINSLKDYIGWQRKFRAGKAGVSGFSSIPKFGPVFINLDLTTGCTFRCPYCVDIKVINKGKFFTYKQVINFIDVLVRHGLKSVLLIGGGEPTLHPDFEKVVRYLKKKKMQVGVVTNGSFMEKIIAVADVLGKGDWVRLSVDAGTNKTFEKLHRPVIKITLDKICKNVAKLKKKNKNLSVGYSYVIIWEGIKINGVKMSSNVNEIPIAAELAKKSGFDYISFKPCMIKMYPSNTESLLHCESKKFKETILKNIKNKIREAEKIGGNGIKVVTTKNLKALFSGESLVFRSQPRYCHSQVFRQIVTPLGSFHCPAYRGFPKAKVGELDAFVDEKKFKRTIADNYKNLVKFRPDKQCKDVVCFYNEANNWIEDFIKSGKNVKDIEPCEDENFFL